MASLFWHMEGWLDGADPALCLQRGQRHRENAVLLRLSPLPVTSSVNRQPGELRWHAVLTMVPTQEAAEAG